MYSLCRSGSYSILFLLITFKRDLLNYQKDNPLWVWFSLILIQVTVTHQIMDTVRLVDLLKIRDRGKLMLHNNSQ